MHALGSYSRGKIDTFVCQPKLSEVICDIIEFTAVKYNIPLAEFIDEGCMNEELFMSTMCAVHYVKSKSTIRSARTILLNYRMPNCSAKAWLRQQLHNHHTVTRQRQYTENSIYIQALTLKGNSVYS